MTGMKQNTLEFILSRDDRFRYQLLDRMRQDCLYFLSYGRRDPRYLWANDAVEQLVYLSLIHIYGDFNYFFVVYRNGRTINESEAA